MHAVLDPRWKLKPVDLTKLDPRPTVPFCGGNSGVECPTTGFQGIPQWSTALNRGTGLHGTLWAWDNTRPTPPDLRSGLFGLGDLGDAHPPGYVVAGTRVMYSASLPANPQGPASSDLASCIQNDLLNGASYTDVAVNPSYGFLGLAGGSITVTVTSLIDRNSISDIQNDITYEIQKCGAPVQNIQMSVVSGPSITGVPAGTEIGINPTVPSPCDSESGLNWIACQTGLGQGAAGTFAGISAGAIMIFGLLTIFILSRR